MYPLHRRPLGRPGFTLVELIIAMTIIVILGTIAVAFLPRLRGHERAARGADQVQRWLLITKMHAQNSRAPSGLRLIVDPNDPNVVFELHTIQEPDPYSKGRFLNSNGTQSTFDGTDFHINGLADDEQPVQPGDYLEVYGGGLVMRITSVANSGTQLTHTPWNSPGTTPTSNYRIMRQPRRLQGDNPLRLPQDIGIDLSRSLNIPTRTVGPTTYREIMFAPAGGVVGKGTTADKIIFWVRDVTDTNPLGGSPTLIVVYTRTGLIAAHPVDVAGSDPYSFAKDPRSSGL